MRRLSSVGRYLQVTWWYPDNKRDEKEGDVLGIFKIVKN